MKVFKLSAAILLFWLANPVFGLEEATDEVNTNLHLKILSLKKAGPPEIWDGKLILTYLADSNPRYVAASFGFENYRTKYYFKKLEDKKPAVHGAAGDSHSSGGHYLGRSGGGGTDAEAEAAKAKLTKLKKPAPVEKVLYFLVLNLPEGHEAPHGPLAYRLIVDGLWQTDPANPDQGRDDQGIAVSFVQQPHETGYTKLTSPVAGYDGEVEFIYHGKPGQRVSVMGSFNQWDPFLHPMDEEEPGVYTLKVTLLAGPVQYLYVVGTRHVVDPANPRSVWDANRNQYSVFENHIHHHETIPRTEDPPKPPKKPTRRADPPAASGGGH